MEGDPKVVPGSSQQYKISIHSLRMEGDSEADHQLDLQEISIHSLRMEGDLVTDGFH